MRKNYHLCISISIEFLTRHELAEHRHVSFSLRTDRSVQAHIYHQLIDGHQKGSARRPSRRFRSPICSLLADRELAAANKPHESDAAPLNSVFLPPIIRSAVAFGMEHTRSSGTNQPGHLLRLCARPWPSPNPPTNAPRSTAIIPRAQHVAAAAASVSLLFFGRRPPPSAVDELRCVRVEYCRHTHHHNVPRSICIMKCTHI